ncbi:MAG: YidC/Oxa1 family rane protein insertase [Chloroflexota bacterium]|nr:YidC/Oxa1 family rane protein insertase [Chloroflexota bacterium]
MIEDNLAAVLNFIYVHFESVPALASIGAYGLAIVVLTIGLRLILSPLQQFQLVTQRKSMLEQRKLAPEVAALKKKFKGQQLQLETQKLYSEHGINPLAGMVGCLPLLVQAPILMALYYVFTSFAHGAKVAAHFLFIPNLNDNPNHHLLASLPLFGTTVGIPLPAYLLFPLLAAATTFVQTKMLQMPPSPNLTEQEAQAQQMQKMMVWMSPLMIGWFALNVPAGLGLYWFIGNCVGIIQQYFVVGWGNLLPRRNDPGTAAVVVKPSGGPKPVPGSSPKPVPGGSPKPVPANGPRNGGRNGSRNGGNRSKRRR